MRKKKKKRKSKKNRLENKMSPEFIVTTLKGAEPFLKKELSRYGIKSNQSDYFCSLETTKKQLLKFAYFSQLAERICIKKGESEIKNIKVPASLKKEPFHPIIIANEDKKDSIREYLEENRAVRYNSEKVVLIIQQEENNLFWAEDLFSLDFSKRDYKVFISPRTLHPIIGASLAYMSQLKPDYRIFDPFCNDGVVIIELALFMLHKSPNFYRKHIFDKEFFDFNTERYLEELDKQEKNPKLRLVASDTHTGSLSYTRKNAKIAGVHKKIQFSRKELEWIDAEFYKEPINRIISFPKPYSKRLKDFYHYLKECLTKESFLLYALDKELDHPLEKEGFSVEEKAEFWQGKKKIKIVKINP
jgi:23S rRNA G2445 N2-methylase RlmL